MASKATLAAIAVVLLAQGCATKVKVEVDKPIDINLNVNIRQEVVVKLERDVQDLLRSNPGVF